MSTEPDDLIERLREALAEHERIARLVHPADAAWIPGTSVFDALAAVADPPLMLRTIQAHRKILARHRLDDDAPAGDPFCSWCGRLHQADSPDYPCDDLRDLASIYFPEGTG